MPPIQPNKDEAPIPHSIHAIGFALPLAVSKLPFGTTSATNSWPLGLQSCWGSAVSEPCLQSNQISRSSHPTLYPRHRFCFAFSGFEAAVRHHVGERIRGPLGLNLAGVPLFRNHASIQPKKAEAPIPHSIHAIGFALLLAVSKLSFGTTSANEFVAPWASILLGFRCFGTMPPIQPKKAQAPIPHSIHAIGFALLLAVSKLPFGITSANEFVAPWASILLGFRCFGTMPPIHLSSHPTLNACHRFCFAFSGFEAAVRHHVCERIRGSLGLNPAGVPPSHTLSTP